MLEARPARADSRRHRANAKGPPRDMSGPWCLEGTATWLLGGRGGKGDQQLCLLVQPATPRSVPSHRGIFSALWRGPPGAVRRLRENAADPGENDCGRVGWWLSRGTFADGWAGCRVSTRNVHRGAAACGVRRNAAPSARGPVDAGPATGRTPCCAAPRPSRRWCASAPPSGGWRRYRSSRSAGRR